jgi:hypothetical protein
MMPTSRNIVIQTALEAIPLRAGAWRFEGAAGMLDFDKKLSETARAALRQSSGLPWAFKFEEIFYGRKVKKEAGQAVWCCGGANRRSRRLSLGGK